MSTTQPVRDKEALEKLKDYYRTTRPNPRNSALIILGLNTALRISDILRLKWGDIYEDGTHMKEHLEIREHKTGKTNIIALNRSVRENLSFYKKTVFGRRKFRADEYLFLSQKGVNGPISRSQAYRIIKDAAEGCGLSDHISCHSLRKTFGYHAWKQGTPPALLMSIFNHSSYGITKKYLCIEQDERDEVYQNVVL